MRKWVYDCWNSVMDHEKNPLSVIPDFSTRHMIMQVLAWMWCIVFGIIVGSMYAGVFSMVLHTLLLGAVAITVGTFETAKRKPEYFGGYGRGQGGEHEQMFNAVKEIIWHLTCTSCNNWFTYATMEEKLRIERYSFHCPHCGIKGSARINNEKED